MVAAPGDFAGFPALTECFGWPSVGISDVRNRANLVAATGTELAACGQILMAANTPDPVSTRYTSRKPTGWSILSELEH
jgi:hypothetical protein